ncbi:MAG: hypothetical protein ACI909_002958 [Planctomycetota bacterium]|jgi:hypothetical protein
MHNSDKTELDIDSPDGLENDLSSSIETNRKLNEELSFLFGQETVELAGQIDNADLNFNKDILACISAGVKRLKQFKHDPDAQIKLINEMEPGARLVLCMWIMDMDLLDKIQSDSYLNLKK